MPEPAPDVPRGTSTALVAPSAEGMPIQVAPGISILPLYGLQEALVPYETNLEDIEGQVDRAEIASQDAYQGGSDLLSAIQAEIGRLEAKRVEVKKPADDFGKMVQKLVMPLAERLASAKIRLNQKMLVWYRAEEERKRKAQEEIRRQQQEEADRLAAKAREQGQEETAAAIEEMVAAAPTAPAPKVGMTNYAGKTHGKRVYWNGEAVAPMEILKAIIAGNIPISAVEFNKSTLNKIAADHAAKLTQKERDEFPVPNGVVTVTGIKITKDEKLV